MEDEGNGLESEYLYGPDVLSQFYAKCGEEDADNGQDEAEESPYQEEESDDWLESDTLKDYFPACEGEEGHSREDEESQEDEEIPPVEPQPPKESGIAHLYVFTAEKGGMQGFDKELQQKVIEEMSKGSKHLQHAQAMDTRLSRRIALTKSELFALTEVQLRKARVKSQEMLAEVERQRPSGRWCCVVDMDMFFAAVEIKDNPSLAEKPVAVGGRSMISTANYVARKYGVRSAMPGFIGEELCRRQGVKLVFVPHSSKRYAEEAAAVRGVIAKYGPYSSMSQDEAKVDLTEKVRGRYREMCAGGVVTTEVAVAEEVLKEMRGEIYQVTRLTVSGAVGTNFMLAKIGADVNKPNGQFVVPLERDKMLEWFQELSVRKIPGIGKVTERVLKEGFEVHKIKDIIANHAVLTSLMEHRSLRFLTRSALGIANDMLADYSNAPENAVSRQSLGQERTFRTESNPQKLREHLKKLCVKVAGCMEEKQLVGKSVTLKLKRSDFKVLSRQGNAVNYLKTAEELFVFAEPLLDKEIPISVRLMGVKVGKFKGQISYKEAKDKTQRRLTSFIQQQQQQPSNNSNKNELCLSPTTSSSSSSSDVIVIGHKDASPSKRNPPPTPPPPPLSAKRRKKQPHANPGTLRRFLSKGGTSPVGSTKAEPIELD